MSAQIIDGKEIALQIKLELKKEIEKLKEDNIFPGLATVLVGNDPASTAYVRMKEKMCKELGIINKSVKLSSDITEKQLLKIIKELELNKVGLPLANILVKKSPGANATVTVCHTGTKNISQITKQADILIAAIGSPEIITQDMVAHKTVVIDVGVNRVEAPEKKQGYRLVGDVQFDSVSQKVKAISPVPGGVGPMTIIMLMKNTVKAAKLANL